MSSHHWYSIERYTGKAKVQSDEAKKDAQKAARKASRSRRVRRAMVVAAVVLLVALVVFAEIVRPNQDAKAYTGRLQLASQPLNDCFQKLADTTELDIYYAPDISIKDRQNDAKTISNQIAACRTQLADFDKTSHNLLSLHFAGYTQTYHEAKVNQRQAFDVVGQSEDVLNQYAALATFLSQYYDHINAYLNYFNNLQSLEKDYPYSSPPRASINVMAGQASDLHKRAAAIRGMDAPTTFDAVKSPTADMFDSMATGFENVVKGYTNYSDYYKSIGYQQVDKSVAMYDGTVVNLPFTELQASYVPKQVQQLPVKIKNLLAAQVE